MQNVWGLANKHYAQILTYEFLAQTGIQKQYEPYLWDHDNFEKKCKNKT